MPSIEQPDYDELRELPGFQCRRARLSRQAGSERLGLSLWEVPPGEAAYPYHLHLGDEELVVVLDGRPSLRTPAGWRGLERGEVVAFLRGEEGAHQIVNRSDEPVRFLAFSPNGEPDIVVQPDSDKLGVFERIEQGNGLRAFFRRADSVHYSEGEQPPE